MTIYQFIPFIMIALIIAIIVRTILTRKKTLPVKLFFEGLKLENNGNFEEAILNYEIALTEIKKNRSRSSLEQKIREKLKVLRSVIEYNNSLEFTR